MKLDSILVELVSRSRQDGVATWLTWLGVIAAALLQQQVWGTDLSKLLDSWGLAGNTPRSESQFQSVLLISMIQPSLAN